MGRKEYLDKRNALLNEAKELLDAGKVAEAKAKKEEIENLDAGYQAAAEARADIEAMSNTAIPKMYNSAAVETNATVQENSADPDAYRRAWLKNMAHDEKTGRWMIGEMTPEEMNAFTFTTANTDDLVPKTVMNRIIELVDSMAPMYDDSTKSNMTKGFGIPRHTAIAAGDAAATNEGVANADEEDTFDMVDLTGVEIKKHVKLTRKMEFQSIDAFEDWLVRHLSARIAVAKEARIRAQLDDNTVGIAAANVLTAQTYEDATIRSIFAKIHGQGAKVIYANNATIWNGLFGIADEMGRPIFVPDPTSDPTTAGSIYGAKVKQDENLAANVAYIGIPSRILTNDFDPLYVSTSEDSTTFVKTIGAYSLFDAGLEDPLAFVKVTFTAG